MKPWRIHSSSASSLSVWKTPPTTSSRARCEFDGPYYEEEIEEMKATASTTMFIDFSHVMRYNDFLHQTISDEYLEFEPYLRSACRDFGWNICMLKRSNGGRRQASSSNSNSNTRFLFIIISPSRTTLCILDPPCMAVLNRLLRSTTFAANLTSYLRRAFATTVAAESPQTGSFTPSLTFKKDPQDLNVQ